MADASERRNARLPHSHGNRPLADYLVIAGRGRGLWKVKMSV